MTRDDDEQIEAGIAEGQPAEPAPEPGGGDGPTGGDAAGGSLVGGEPGNAPGDREAVDAIGLGSETGAQPGASAVPGDRGGENLPHAAEAVMTVDAVMDSAVPEAPVLNDQLVAIIEAIVFASPEPITLKAILKLLASEPTDQVQAAIAELRRRYEDRPGGLQLVEVANGYQIVTRPDLHDWVRRMFHERTTQKLSVQALETLAVIAYKQPITAAEITDIRGVNTSGVIGTLLERGLVRISGRKQVVGRPFLYSTTRDFLDRFGLRDLHDLPKVEDMAEALGFEVPAGIATDAQPLLPADEPATQEDAAVMEGGEGEADEECKM